MIRSVWCDWHLLQEIDVENPRSVGNKVAVSANGTHIAISSVNDANYSFVRVYTQAAGGWSQVGADIVGDVVTTEDSDSVALSSDGLRLVIGSPERGARGQVQILQFGESWNEGDTLTGEKSGDKFGSAISLSLSGAIVAIGDPYYDVNGKTDAGQVTIYEWTGSAFSLLGNVINGEASTDLFGSAVSLSSDGVTVAIGAPQYGSFNSGHVRIFRYYSSSWQSIAEFGLGGSGPQYLGSAVSLSPSGDFVAIGSPNYGKTYLYYNSAASWSYLTTISSETSTDKTGCSVSFSDNGFVAVGAKKMLTVTMYCVAMSACSIRVGINMEAILTGFLM